MNATTSSVAPAEIGMTYKLSRSAIIKLNEVEGISAERTKATFAKFDAWAAEGLTFDEMRDRLIAEAKAISK